MKLTGLNQETFKSVTQGPRGLGLRVEASRPAPAPGRGVRAPSQAHRKGLRRPQGRRLCALRRLCPSRRAPPRSSPRQPLLTPGLTRPQPTGRRASQRGWQSAPRGGPRGPGWAGSKGLYSEGARFLPGAPGPAPATLLPALGRA